LVVSEVAQMYVGGEPGQQREPDYPLLYGPVFVRGDQSQLRVQVPVEMSNEEYQRRMMAHGQVSLGYRDVRVMLRPSFEFDWFGTIYAEGFEAREDGALIEAFWEIEPYKGSEQ
jgi:hypothetical protein